MKTLSVSASIYLIVLMSVFYFSSCCYDRPGGYDTHRRIGWRHHQRNVIIVHPGHEVRPR